MLQSSTITTEQVDKSVQEKLNDFKPEKLPDLTSIILSDELELSDSSRISSQDQSSVFREEFVIKEAEIAPVKGLIGDALNLYDFESLAA